MTNESSSIGPGILAGSSMSEALRTIMDSKFATKAATMQNQSLGLDAVEQNGSSTRYSNLLATLQRMQPMR